MKIVDVEGIGPAYAGQLGVVGVKTTGDLLAR
jgi:predicted flap endonuclease-1-like 5' DNA nuclease